MLCKRRASLCPAVWSANIDPAADNSLAQPGRKQATATENFDVHISYL